MQLMSQNLRLRKHGRGLYDSEEIARLDEIIGNSSSPEEALCKRCSLFVYNDPTSSTDAALLEETDEMKLVDDNPLIHTRRKQISSLAADIMSRVRRGFWLRDQLDEGTTHFDRLLESIEQDRFGDLLVTAGIKMLLKRAKAISDPNDGSMFYLAALEVRKAFNLKPSITFLSANFSRKRRTQTTRDLNSQRTKRSLSVILITVQTACVG